MLIIEATPSTVPRPPTACSYLQGVEATGQHGFMIKMHRQGRGGDS